MKLVNDVVWLIVTLVLAGGLIWAAVVWQSRRQTAALVAAACALQLAVRLLWLPGIRFLFGQMAWATNPAQRFFISAGAALGQLSLAVSLGLLFFAALASPGRKA
jgi:hypothetical protein